MHPTKTLIATILFGLLFSFTTLAFTYNPTTTFTRDLKLGMSGSDVKELQIFLNNNGFIVSDTGAGSIGKETSYFGKKTKEAVIKFQETHRSDILTPLSIKHGTGLFYSSTRSFINNSISTPVITVFIPQTTSTTSVVVSIPATTTETNIPSVSHTLSYSADTGGIISGSSTQVVDYNTNGTAVLAIPNNYYSFSGWSDGITTNPRIDTNVIENKTITANFYQPTYSSGVRRTSSSYTFTYTAGDNGTISGVASQKVNRGQSGTTITAVPSTGYHFTSWSDGVLTAERTDTNATANISVSASFEINTYTFAYSAGDNGSITGSSTQIINYGTNATAVTAVPSTGYHFTSWSDGVLTAERTDTNATANISVSASFDVDTYSSYDKTVSKIQEEGGYIYFQNGDTIYKSSSIDLLDPNVSVAITIPNASHVNFILGENINAVGYLDWYSGWKINLYTKDWTFIKSFDDVNFTKSKIVNSKLMLFNESILYSIDDIEKLAVEDYTLDIIYNGGSGNNQIQDIDYFNGEYYWSTKIYRYNGYDWGFVLFKGNAGEQTQIKTIHGYSEIAGLVVNNNGIVWHSTQDGVIYFSTDGSNWIEKHISDTPDLDFVGVEPNGYFAVGKDVDENFIAYSKAYVVNLTTNPTTPANWTFLKTGLTQIGGAPVNGAVFTTEGNGYFADGKYIYLAK